MTDERREDAIGIPFGRFEHDCVGRQALRDRDIARQDDDQPGIPQPAASATTADVASSTGSAMTRTANSVR